MVIRILIACDKFRGSLTAGAANKAIRTGLAASGLAATSRCIAIADGGEGTVDAFCEALGGRRLAVVVEGPFGAPATAEVFFAKADGLTVIESAAAVGHRLAADLDPDRASSFGIGQMILAALGAGARRIVLGLGGSVTVDGGAGLLAALGARHLDVSGREIPRPAGRQLQAIDRLDLTGLDPRLVTIAVEIASDVDNPLLGPSGAAAVFGPQKGVASEDVTSFDAALAHYDRVVAAALGRAPGADRPFFGAAGGMLVGLSAACEPVCRDGFGLIAEATGLAAAVGDADLVVTGEGSLDSQSLGGKGPIALARMAAAARVPAIAFAGRVRADGAALADAGILAAFPIVDGPIPLEDALVRGSDLLTERAAAVFRLIAATEQLA